MDIQKMQVRADLERMVYNYRLMNRIETYEADQIISCLGRVIGSMPEPQAARLGKIIPFPKVEIGEQEPSKPDREDPWELGKRISEELGLWNIKYLGWRVLTAIRYAGVKSVEELARYPLEKLKKNRGVGEKAVNAIIEALRAKGHDITMACNECTKPEETKV
jgi:DNA-directed RNA polymerase alpha subunit